MEDRTKEKLLQIQELIKQKEEIDRKIELLLSPEKAFTVPPDFSLNNEIISLLGEAGSTGLATTTIVGILVRTYPEYGIDRKKVASSLAYLKNTKKLVMQTGRGMYKLYENQW